MSEGSPLGGQIADAGKRLALPRKAMKQTGTDRVVLVEAVFAAVDAEFLMQRTGHGIGLEVHEPPYITASSDTVLDEGTTFTVLWIVPVAS